jgi:hypothetical protein
MVLIIELMMLVNSFSNIKHTFNVNIHQSYLARFDYLFVAHFTCTIILTEDLFAFKHLAISYFLFKCLMTNEVIINAIYLTISSFSCCKAQNKFNKAMPS